VFDSDERPTWKVYEVQTPDMFGYANVKYGVREEYTDGATRYIHNEALDSADEAQLLAARFNGYARKGRTYDNRMKTWSE
jgi:hypothetical protein